MILFALLSRRARVAVALGAVLFVVASGYAARSATSTRHGPPGAVTITFWQSTNPQESAFTTKLVHQWNASHKDIYINLQFIPAGTSTEEVFDAAVAAHKTPDITNNLLPAIVPQFAQEGGLYPLDTLPDFLSYMKARMPPGTLEKFQSRDGHYYQVPWKANPVMIIYRPDLLKKAGIRSFPRTYSAFMHALRAIKQKTGVNPIFPTINPTWYHRFFDFYPFYLAQSQGVTLLNNNVTKAIFQNHGATRVMRFWRAIYAQGLAPKSASAADKWKPGLEAMYIAGPWGPAFEVLSNGAGQIPWAVAPIPVPDGTHAPAYPYTYSDPKNITIFRTCTHPKQAWAFIKWYINRQNDEAFLRATWEFPFRKDLVADPLHFSALFQRYPQLIQFAKQLPHMSGLDNSPQFVQIFDAVSAAWEASVVNDTESPRAAVTSAADRIDGIVRAGP
jgi:multiple sugar transport system substrate-binding protein